jgi:Family of unknown function (DUF6525)
MLGPVDHVAYQEGLINDDLSKHDRLPAEIRQLMRDAHFHWPARLAIKMHRELKLPFDQIKLAFQQMDAARAKSIIDDALRSPKSEPDAPRITQPSPLDTRLQLQVRAALGPQSPHLQQRRNTPAQRRRQAKRERYRALKAKRQPLSPMCAFGLGGRMGACRERRAHCLCLQAIRDQDKAKRSRSLEEGHLNDKARAHLQPHRPSHRNVPARNLLHPSSVHVLRSPKRVDGSNLLAYASNLLSSARAFLLRKLSRNLVASREPGGR